MMDMQMIERDFKQIFNTPFVYKGISSDDEFVFHFFCVDVKEQAEFFLKIINFEKEKFEGKARILPIFFSKEETKMHFSEMYNKYMLDFVSNQKYKTGKFREISSVHYDVGVSSDNPHEILNALNNAVVTNCLNASKKNFATEKECITISKLPEACYAA